MSRKRRARHTPGWWTDGCGVTRLYEDEGYELYEKVNEAALKEIAVKTETATGKTTTAGKTYETKVWCTHTGERPLVTLDGIAIHGAQGLELTGYEADLIVDLSGAYKPSSVGFVITKAWEKLEEYAQHPGELLRLAWADRSVPPVGAEFWKALWEEIKARGFKSVVFCCSGGHGRTGTAIAAVLIAVRGTTAEKAMKFVRLQHCDQAIETLGQEEYLRALARQVKREAKEQT